MIGKQEGLKMIEDTVTFIFTILLPYMSQGVVYTLEVSLPSLGIGFIGGLLLAVMRVYGPRYLAWLVGQCVSIVRGTPLLVQLFIIYFGLPSVGIILDRFVAAVAAISLNSSAYQSEYFRGAIQSVSGGQMEAAEALGFTRFKAIWNVILPQALRFALPAWSNEGTYLIKGSSIVFMIGSLDLTASGKILDGIYLRPFEIFFVVAGLYVIMIVTFSKTVSLLISRYRIPGFGSK
jgi:polar amino acid transport system permease protein